LQYLCQMADKAHEVTWPMEVVVQELMKGFKGKWVPAELMIGLDARLAYLVVTMLPTWLVHFIYGISNSRPPMPNMMKKN